MSTRGTGRLQPGHGDVEELGERVRVGAGPQHVVAAAREADQAGRHRRRRGNLLGHDLPQQLAADREVRVPQSRVLGGQQARQPVRPAAEPAAGRGVVQSLGEAVAERDEGRGNLGICEERVDHRCIHNASSPRETDYDGMTERGKLSAALRPPWDTGWMRAGKILLAAVACTVAACSSGVAATETQTAPPPAQVTLGTGGAGGTGSYPAAAWPQYDQNAARTGVAADLPAAGPLSHRVDRPPGRRRLRPAARGRRHGHRRDRERQRLRAQRINGRGGVAHHLGTPVPRSTLQCGDIDPLGITGTPVYDQGNGLVYAVAETPGTTTCCSGWRSATAPSGCSATSTSPPRATSPPTTSSGPRWPSAAGGSTPRSAGWPATAAPTSAHRRGAAVRQRAAGQLAHPDHQGGRHLGHRRAGHRPGRGPVGLHGERGGRKPRRAV